MMGLWIPILESNVCNVVLVYIKTILEVLLYGRGFHQIIFEMEVNDVLLGHKVGGLCAAHG